MKALLGKMYFGLTGLLPSRVAGRLDLRCLPSYRASWGGPLNGQARRREMVRELACAIKFDRVLETGTYRGTSTEFFSAVFGAPVESVENDPRSFAYSRERLRPLSDVTVHFGDSRQFLNLQAKRTTMKTEVAFIYLDAHWQHDLPLAEELRIVASTWTRCLVMIDDFQVPGDSGYAYDDYGPGVTLSEEYLPASVLKGWSLLYPSMSSAEETGARRGCCVLASPAMAESVQVPSLRLSNVL